MKTYLFLLFAFFSGAVKAQKNFPYEISGTIDGLKNDTLYVFIHSDSPEVENPKTDTIILPAKNDKVFTKGSYPKTAFAYAQIGSKQSGRNFFTFIIEEGKIQLRGNVSSPENIRATGAPQNDAYTAAMSADNAYYRQRDVYWTKLQSGDESKPEYKKAEAAAKSVEQAQLKFRQQYVKEHPTLLASGMFVYLLPDQLPVAEFEKLYLALHDDVKSLSMLANLPERIAAKKNVAVGKTAPLFTMNDTEGKPVSLSSFKGKYVLLDFWASWCAPCRAENPYLVKAYQKYKDKNFTIVSISSDDKGDWWRKAIEKDGLNWVHLSDLSGAKNPVAKLYGVQPIPDNFLIDPAGTIIARGLHGEEVEKKLNEIIK
ncbi:TlpA disulfide reductase family protein [Sphingobacterium athyrii]|uniref:Thioredoxin domain-containing protein n=1 Tax=Sphingobacterium athyrii TaxID=2152717 RepID=A0A363NUS4_9SPHI|nr:TlpA disulfide reductase family protein [Sphingobacterium athyrii]PUV24507.1 hypothetical protein DCO56_14285 [Sphingobacterium athyrii]